MGSLGVHGARAGAQTTTSCRETFLAQLKPVVVSSKPTRIHGTCRFRRNVASRACPLEGVKLGRHRLELLGHLGVDGITCVGGRLVLGHLPEELSTTVFYMSPLELGVTQEGSIGGLPHHMWVKL